MQVVPVCVQFRLFPQLLNDGCYQSPSSQLTFSFTVTRRNFVIYTFHAILRNFVILWQKKQSKGKKSKGGV